MTLTQEEVRRVFEYKDGKFYWKEMSTDKIANIVGQLAGYIHPTGYRLIRVHGYQYKAHRLMFLYHHGYIPDFVDHINGVKDDNRIENLRAATKAQNCQNTFLRLANTSGVKGVSKMPRLELWRTRLQSNGKKYEVGGFKTRELAADFIELLRDLTHGEFANHGLKGA
jgi:hypothetical protein